MERVVLFDGVCNFCNDSVQFIIKRDPEGHFKFASIQSETGQRLLEMHGISKEMNSFVYVEKGKIYVKSGAALRICKHLKGSWKLLSTLQIVPPFIRDFFYTIIANNRYRWFGKSESCMLPTPEMKERFLE